MGTSISSGPRLRLRQAGTTHICFSNKAQAASQSPAVSPAPGGLLRESRAGSPDRLSFSARQSEYSMGLNNADPMRVNWGC